jgi:hypothetical protein
MIASSSTTSHPIGRTTWDLFIVSTHGGPPSVLLQHPANDVRPFWISNGSAVAFTSDRSGAAAADLPSVRGCGTGWRPSIDGRQHPGFAWDHDLQIDPTGTVAAFDHFSRARVAELWVLRHLTHPLD